MTIPPDATDPGSPPTAPPTFRQALRVFAYIGIHSFGGPAGQIAVMHKVLVEDRRWISEERFLHALNYCMLLPGPEATQLVTYVGWLMHRTMGGIAAGVLFVLPGFISILALTLAYTLLRDVGVVEALLFGLKAATLAIVVEAVIRIGKRVLKNGVMLAIAAAAFVAIFGFGVPFPLIIVSAALIGLIGSRIAPGFFAVLKPKAASDEHAAIVYATDIVDNAHTRPNAWRTVRTIMVWLTLWLGPVIAIRAWLGPGHIFTLQAEFFSKAAVVTFGGAYAVLAYIAQQAVEVYGWLAPGEMLTGLGMAETTPGPLIQVVQFVGSVGAFHDPGPLSPVSAAVLAAVLVTWVTFVPCFLWIFAGAPYVEAVRGKPALAAALSSITAAVVGVVLNLAVWFAAHTLFRETFTVTDFGLRLTLPRLSTLDPAALVVAAMAAFVLFRLHWGVMKTLALALLLGLVWHAIGYAAGRFG
ncbi:MAG: chromate efflux transporter [Phycisphaeraceae bacterium]|nr:chromate efflux transporter [Phycisphaeraceae bacterium]MCW5761759.1 chromate efflux transporter [Phycisphaeraceae bacterium]